MTEPLFIATERFDPSDGEAWQKYFAWANIPQLAEVVGLDAILSNRLIREILDEDWNHIVNADFRLDYFYHLDYLMNRIKDIPRRNVLGLYRNAARHIDKAPGDGDFRFLGHDLIDEQSQISALTNCGGFPDVFDNEELNGFGLLGKFERASEVKNLLKEKHPKEPHANCELYAIWRLNEKSPQ